MGRRDAKKKPRRAEKPTRHGLEAAVAGAADHQGLFLLVRGGVWEFLSARTGASVLCWFADDGTWTTTGGDGPRRGKAPHAFAALAVARRKERALRGGGPNRPGQGSHVAG
jgi:hypothetical protein